MTSETYKSSRHPHTTLYNKNHFNIIFNLRLRLFPSSLQTTHYYTFFYLPRAC